MTEESTWARVVIADAGGASRRPDRARQTVLRMLGGSLVAMLVLVAVGYGVGARLADRQALAGAAQFTRMIGDTVIGPHLTPALLRGDPGSVQRLDRVVRQRLVRATSIERVKVWSLDGRVLYSDDHAEIGEVHDVAGSDLQDLATGSDAATVSTLQRAENAAERRIAPRLLEVYTVARAVDGHRVVIEAYLSYAEVKQRRASTLTMLSVLAGVLLGVFALVQVWLGHANLRWLRRRQSELDRQAEEVSVRERRRLARDLHDGVVQELVGTAYAVDGARALARRGDHSRADTMMGEAGEGVRASIQTLRSTLIEVYPPSLAERGLGQALGDLVEPQRARGVLVSVEDLVDRPLPTPVLESAYRVAQEAVRNVARHARAATLLVRVEVDGDRLRLLVRDDGIGLTPDRLDTATDSDGHFGLRMLADAALERGGRLEVATAPGAGCEVVWEVPL